MYLVYAWSTNRGVGDAAADVGVGRKTAMNVYQWCRDMCSWRLLSDPAVQLGGPGRVVQVDESVFTHQGKVRSYTFNFVKHFI